MKRYSILLRWRSRRLGVFTWRLDGVARDSATLVSGLMGYFGPGVFISVRAIQP